MISRALASRGSAASKPWTIIVASARVSRGSRWRARKARKEMSRPFTSLRATRCACVKMFTGCSFPSNATSCVRVESTAAIPAFCKRENVASGRP
jgi:hypothetical protein